MILLYIFSQQDLFAICFMLALAVAIAIYILPIPKNKYRIVKNEEYYVIEKWILFGWFFDELCSTLEEARKQIEVLNKPKKVVK